MKTRTINVEPHQIRVEGSVWSRELTSLVFEEYDNGKITRRARIRMRPIDLRELANRLWEIHRMYTNQLERMTVALRNPD